MKQFVNYLTRELQLSEEKSEIIEYGLFSLLYSWLSIFTALVLGALFGLWQETIAIMFMVMLYRKVSGGAHIGTPLGCLITGTAAILLLASFTSVFGPKLAGNLIFAILSLAITFIIAYIWVPADVPQKPITDPQQIKKLRALSFCLILAWGLAGIFLFWRSQQFAYYYFAGNLGLLWQSFLLTPPGYSFTAYLDRFFVKK